jgi:hypothetical protein
VEGGVAFQGPPDTTLNLTGSACTTFPISACLDVDADPTVQSNVRAEQDKLNDDLKGFQFYPVISVGFGWRF